MEFVGCRFNDEGRCIHRDCPIGNNRCIGKDECGSWQDELIEGLSDKVKSIAGFKEDA